MEPLLVNQVAARTATLFPDRERVACAKTDSEHQFTDTKRYRPIRRLAGAMEALPVGALERNTPYQNEGSHVSLDEGRQFMRIPRYKRKMPDMARVKTSGWEIQANGMALTALQIS